MFFLPIWGAGERTSLCPAKDTIVKTIYYGFAWGVLGSWLLVKVVWHFIIWNRARRANMQGGAANYTGRISIAYAAIEFFFYFVAMPAWFYWSMLIWTEYDKTKCA
jgi:hypothetical protein